MSCWPSEQSVNVWCNTGSSCHHILKLRCWLMSASFLSNIGTSEFFYHAYHLIFGWQDDRRFVQIGASSYDLKLEGAVWCLLTVEVWYIIFSPQHNHKLKQHVLTLSIFAPHFCTRVMTSQPTLDMLLHFASVWQHVWFLWLITFFMVLEFICLLGLVHFAHCMVSDIMTTCFNIFLFLC